MVDAEVVARSVLVALEGECYIVAGRNSTAVLALGSNV
jgi:hypothetical protein